MSRRFVQFIQRQVTLAGRPTQKHEVLFRETALSRESGLDRRTSKRIKVTDVCWLALRKLTLQIASLDDKCIQRNSHYEVDWQRSTVAPDSDAASTKLRDK